MPFTIRAQHRHTRVSISVAMHRSRCAAAAATLALCGAALLPSAAPAAGEPYEINVILPLTGGGSFIGQGAAGNFKVLESIVNKEGGVEGRPVKFVFHDDETNPQQDVQIATQLIPTKPAVMLGSAIVGLCNGIAPLVKNGPVLYCISPSFMPVKDGYAFSAGSATLYQIGAIVRYMRLKGWSNIGVLNGIDATGQNADKDLERLLALPENKDVKVVEHQHFNPRDVSVTAQMERIKSSGAQALIAWTTGAPVATIFKGMIQSGLDIPVGTSSGNQTFAQMEQYAGFLPKTLLIGSALFPEHTGIVTLDPRVEKAQQDMYAALKANNLRPDISTATTWDVGLIVISGLRKFSPNPTADQLRQYISTLTDFPGIDGIYDFKTYYDHGLGPESATVVTYDPQAKSWQWLSKPGGEPLR
jgi:branched-chain amino acid transport system substrate-binding protein